jgi:RNA recognition motif-containing protein
MAETAPNSKGVRLHIKNLSSDMTTEKLMEAFAKYGSVNGGEAKVDKEGTCKGFGFVIMAAEADATTAMKELDGKVLGEKEISVSLPAPKAEKPPKEDKPDKGKGKKEKGKGKGKTVRAPPSSDPMYSGYAAPAYPDPYSAYAYGMPGMDQMSMQMMMTQQLYMMQMQQMMAGAQAPVASPQQQSPAKGTGKKGKGKGKGKDKGKKVDGKFTGKLKSINTREDKGFGFIECAETMETYGRDVFVSSDLVPKGAKVGDQFKFSVILNDKGQLRATDVASA